jgi:hypothetical protein
MPSHAVAPFAPGLAHTMSEEAKSIDAQPHSGSKTCPPKVLTPSSLSKIVPTGPSILWRAKYGRASAGPLQRTKSLPCDLRPEVRCSSVWAWTTRAAYSACDNLLPHAAGSVLILFSDEDVDGKTLRPTLSAVRQKFDDVFFVPPCKSPPSDEVAKLCDDQHHRNRVSAQTDDRRSWVWCQQCCDRHGDMP